jgi:hypothetical protein
MAWSPKLPELIQGAAALQDCRHDGAADTDDLPVRAPGFSAKITKILARRPFATAGGGIGFVYDGHWPNRFSPKVRP